MSAAELTVPSAPARHRTRTAVDTPTLGVALGVYAAFCLLTWWHASLPWWLLAVGGGYLVGLHGSLQHEAVHGVPFRRPWLNGLLVLPSLWLWLPFSYYRETHLLHHRDERLTCPIDDPESYYLTQARWGKLGGWHRLVRTAMNTALGRLLLGPPYVVVRLWTTSARRIASGDRAHLRHWMLHAPGMAVVLAWVVGICGMPLWEYALLFVYPGISLTLLRSFAEHRAAAEVGHRTAVVEAGPVLSLLFLNNNLHALHHAEPGIAWWERPRHYRQRRSELLAGNDGYVFRGYGDILVRFMVRPKEPVAHPLIQG